MLFFNWLTQPPPGSKKSASIKMEKRRLATILIMIMNGENTGWATDNSDGGNRGNLAKWTRKFRMDRKQWNQSTKKQYPSKSKHDIKSRDHLWMEGAPTAFSAMGVPTLLQSLPRTEKKTSDFSWIFQQGPCWIICRWTEYLPKCTTWRGSCSTNKRMQRFIPGRLSPTFQLWDCSIIWVQNEFTLPS